MTEQGAKPPPAEFHPVVALAAQLVQRSSDEPTLTDSGRVRLATALRQAPDRREAALALLEFAYFLATQNARAAASAIGDVVVAEAGDEIRALGAESAQEVESRVEAARRFLGASRAAPEPRETDGVRAGPAAQFALRRDREDE